MKYTEENLQYYGFRELVELVLFLQKKLNALKEQDYKRLKELEQFDIDYENDKRELDTQRENTIIINEMESF